MVEVLLRHCSYGKKYKRTPESIRLQNKWAVAKLLVWSSVVLVLVAVWPYSISSWQTICVLVFLFIYLMSEIISYISRKKYTSSLELYFSSDFIFFNANQFRGKFNLNDLSIKRVDRKNLSVTRIILAQHGGQNVVIEGFELMDEILEYLEGKLNGKG